MKSYFKDALFKSLTVHVVLIFLLIGKVPGCGRGNGDTDKNGKTIQEDKFQDLDHKNIAEKKTIEVEIEEMKPREGVGIKKPKQFVDRNCGNLEWFGGIGIELELSGLYSIEGGEHQILRIKKVHLNYPADKMGLKAGDLLLHTYQSLVGDPGTNITVNVERDGVQMTFHGTREKICLEPIKE